MTEEPRRHPLFERWLRELASTEGLEEVYAEVTALINALADFGRELEFSEADESHPVHSSDFDMHALRRSPETATTPYASGAPVLRMLYAWCKTSDPARLEVPVLLLGGDKSRLGSGWYLTYVNQAEERLREWARRNSDHQPIRKGRR